MIKNVILCLLFTVVIASAAILIYGSTRKRKKAELELKKSSAKKQPDKAVVNTRLLSEYVALQRELAEMYAGEQCLGASRSILKSMQNLIGLGNAYNRGKTLSEEQIEIYFEDGTKKPLYRAIKPNMEKLPPKLNFSETGVRKEAEAKTERELKAEIEDTLNRLKRNRFKVQSYRVIRSLTEEDILKKVLAMDSKAPAEELIIQLAEKTKKILFKNEIYPFFYDVPEVKGSEQMQRVFADGRFLSIDIPAMFVRDWRSKDYVLLGDAYVGEYVKPAEEN